MRRLTRGEYLRACVAAAVVAPGFLVRPYGSAARYRAYQVRRIKRLIHHAYNATTFYHRRYREAGVSPDDFQDLGDLERFPTTTKEELVEALRVHVPALWRWRRARHGRGFEAPGDSPGRR